MRREGKAKQKQCNIILMKKKEETSLNMLKKKEYTN